MTANSLIGAHYVLLNTVFGCLEAHFVFLKKIAIVHFRVRTATVSHIAYLYLFHLSPSHELTGSLLRAFPKFRKLLRTGKIKHEYLDF